MCTTKLDYLIAADARACRYTSAFNNSIYGLGAKASNKGNPLPWKASEPFVVLGSLGMREHSVGELQKKLEQKFERKDAVVEVIDWLLDLGYLNDQRFAEIFVRSSITKGRGPVRIKQELQQKSVATTVIAEAIELADVDWQQLSAEVLSRRFSEQPSDQKERAKQMRFLQSRGFTPDCIYPLFNWLSPLLSLALMA